MILTIISICILLLGVVFAVLYQRDKWNDLLFGLQLFGLLIGIVFTAICVGMIATINSSTSHDNLKIAYEESITDIQNDYNYIQDLADDKAKSVAIINYNNKVKEFKTEIKQNKLLLDNPWINWFNNYAYRDMDENIVDYIK